MLAPGSTPPPRPVVSAAAGAALSRLELDMARSTPLSVLRGGGGGMVERAPFTRAAYLATRKEISMMLNKLVDVDGGAAAVYADGADGAEDEEGSPTRRWCVACASHPHTVSRMIVDVCSRRTGLAPIISRLVLKHTPGLVHLPVYWSPRDEEHGRRAPSNGSDGKVTDSDDGDDEGDDDPMAPAPLLLAIRNRLVGAHGTDIGLPFDPQERRVQAKGIGTLLQQILTPADSVTPGSRLCDFVAAADVTSVLLYCVLPTMHTDHPSLLAGLVVVRTIGSAFLVGCAEPVMHMLRESLREVSASFLAPDSGGGALDEAFSEAASALNIAVQVPKTGAQKIEVEDEPMMQKKF
jgi:hypothetical protein